MSGRKRSVSRDQVRRLRLAGLPLNIIAVRLGCGQSTVSLIVNELGLRDVPTRSLQLCAMPDTYAVSRGSRQQRERAAITFGIEVRR